MITDSLNARREVGEQAPKTGGNSGVGNGSTGGAKGTSNANKSEVRVNDTLS